MRDDCERRSAAVPRDLPLDGLSEGELAHLAAEEGFQLTEREMIDPKWDGVIRHVLNTVGAVMLAFGVMDEATWMKVMGAISVLVPFVWSWMSKPKVA